MIMYLITWVNKLLLLCWCWTAVVVKDFCWWGVDDGGDGGGGDFAAGALVRSRRNSNWHPAILPTMHYAHYAHCAHYAYYALCTSTMHYASYAALHRLDTMHSARYWSSQVPRLILWFCEIFVFRFILVFGVAGWWLWIRHQSLLLFQFLELRLFSLFLAVWSCWTGSG